MSTLTIQPSNKDTYIKVSQPDANNGDNINLFLYSGSDYDRRLVLSFDFSALPAGASISAATLNLYVHTVAATNRTYWAYELTRTDWVEMEATWNKYKSGGNWTTAGGDYTTTDGASAVVPAASNWMTWDVLDLVQHFQSTHAEVANFLVRDGTEGGTNYASYFHSNNYTTDTTLCPKLAITYTTVQHYTLTAEAGSYTKTGQGAGLKVARKMAAAADSYSLAGQATALRAARKMAAGAGSYSLAGQDAGLRAIRKMAAEGGSYVLTGQAANLKLAKKIPAGAGSYALTGQDAVLRAIRKLAAAGGSYVLTGMDANLALSKHYTLVCEAGYYGEPYSKIFVTLDGRIYKKMGDTYLRLA